MILTIAWADRPGGAWPLLALGIGEFIAIKYLA